MLAVCCFLLAADPLHFMYLAARERDTASGEMSSSNIVPDCRSAGAADSPLYPFFTIPQPLPDPRNVFAREYRNMNCCILDLTWRYASVLVSFWQTLKLAIVI